MAKSQRTFHAFTALALERQE